MAASCAGRKALSTWMFVGFVSLFTSPPPSYGSVRTMLWPFRQMFSVLLRSTSQCTCVILGIASTSAVIAGFGWQRLWK